MQVYFRDGTATEKVVIEYPLGHRRRRAEAIPRLEGKLAANLASRFPPGQAQAILDLCRDQQRLETTAVDELMGMFVQGSGARGQGPGGRAVY